MTNPEARLSLWKAGLHSIEEKARPIKASQIALTTQVQEMKGGRVGGFATARTDVATSFPLRRAFRKASRPGHPLPSLKAKTNPGSSKPDPGF
jgi:hypothetical protein